jgi:hypothetical protein
MSHSRWLRWYDGTVRDGKLRIAAQICGVPVATVIGAWASILEDASTSDPRGTSNRGIRYHSLLLDIDAERLGTLWNALEQMGVIAIKNDSIEVLNWHKRQYETDAKDPTYHARKQKWKQAHKQDGTVRNEKERCGTPETDTETDIYIYTSNDDFEKFWKAYPKRLGTNPKAPAKKKFQAAVKAGTPAVQIIGAAQAYADEQRKLEKTGTEFIAQAVTWLFQRRYEDYQKAPSQGPPADLNPEQRAAWVREQMRKGDG